MKLDNDAVIAVNGLKKRFGAITAVDNISFSVPDCDLLGVLGPNGAGRTTTIRMLPGLLTSDAGDIRLLRVFCSASKAIARKRVSIILSYPLSCSSTPFLRSHPRQQKRQQKNCSLSSVERELSLAIMTPDFSEVTSGAVTSILLDRRDVEISLDTLSSKR